MVKVPSAFLLIISCIWVGGSSSAQTVSWYKCYSGAIDKYPVTLHLHKAGKEYSGHYYYLSQHDPIAFSGTDNPTTGKITLTIYTSDDKKETLDFIMKGNQASGQWHSAGKTLAFTAREDSSKLCFDYIYTSAMIKLKPAKKDSPSATFDAAAVWPKANSQQAIFLKKIINEEFGFTNSAVDIGKNLLSLKRQFFADYIADSINENPASQDWEEYMKMEVVYQSPKLLMLSAYTDEFTGGAHPNHGTRYAAIDLVNNKRITINDVVTNAGFDKLVKLLESTFRKQREVKETDSLTEAGLFENKIEPNNNFYVTAKGIWFSYNPYEIGPYVMGDIELFIGMPDLKDYLQPAFKKLIE